MPKRKYRCPDLTSMEGNTDISISNWREQHSKIRLDDKMDARDGLGFPRIRAVESHESTKLSVGYVRPNTF